MGYIGGPAGQRPLIGNMGHDLATLLAKFTKNCNKKIFGRVAEDTFHAVSYGAGVTGGGREAGVWG